MFDVHRDDERGKAMTENSCVNKMILLDVTEWELWMSLIDYQGPHTKVCVHFILNIYGLWKKKSLYEVTVTHSFCDYVAKCSITQHQSQTSTELLQLHKSAFFNRLDFVWLFPVLYYLNTDRKIFMNLPVWQLLRISRWPSHNRSRILLYLMNNKGTVYLIVMSLLNFLSRKVTK